jgi:nitroimidazol reductase NimA-like FMN-containing flavoprotein (pyridoxamine 5'-phosphate oxidase superfamily)
MSAGAREQTCGHEERTMSLRMLSVEIEPDACVELLSSTPLGRLGVVVDGRPEIFPVNHAFDRRSGCVVFATNERTKLDAALHWPWVAYEVDGLEEVHAETREMRGWSVLVVGTAQEIDDRAEIVRVASLPFALWQAGDRVRWIRIVPSKITGRRVTLSGGSPARDEGEAAQRDLRP